jgi:hypothetical protein
MKNECVLAVSPFYVGSGLAPLEVLSTVAFVLLVS